MKKLLFVFNPHAGKGLIKNELCDIVDIFTRAGFEVTVYPTQAPRDGMNKIINDGLRFDMIVVSGGDGTLSEAVKAMMKLGTKIPLGYIPAGSTNDFAASMDIPKKMSEAAEAIVNGVPFDYDIGEFNGEYYVYVAAFGAFVDVSYETSQIAKNRFGHMAYIAEGIKRLPTYTGYSMTVEYDGGTVEGSYILGLISNSTSIGGMKRLIGDGVCFDDGLFEVTLVKTPQNAIAFQSLLREAALNKMSDKNFVTFKTSHLKISSIADIAWTLDGESGGMHNKVEIVNHKQAVSIVIKPDGKTAEQQLIGALADDKGLSLPDFTEEDDDEP
ncbi:MAG: diacylglycerol kinase family lipid kinase [Ruminococcus sp.]|nr:diacylglycerol kinase family lipid kinase [Ruminococcus sp.]